MPISLKQIYGSSNGVIKPAAGSPFGIAGGFVGFGAQTISDINTTTGYQTVFSATGRFAFFGAALGIGGGQIGSDLELTIDGKVVSSSNTNSTSVNLTTYVGTSAGAIPVLVESSIQIRARRPAGAVAGNTLTLMLIPLEN